ncbi:hypothetical protein XarjCFBP7653_09045 [Xanthomonas arboricola]|nr:hypothetical protein XarjCFBP7653_09045 [Xanthomonas arboricola]
MRTDYPDWSLPAHRRGTLSGMDAAPEPTWTYLRRVPRWWAGKGPAANSQRRGRTCGVSCDGGRARARQHTRSVEDVLAACPAMVGGQGPCSQLAASRTYLRRVPRWWAGKGPAANSQRRGRTCGVSRDGGRARACTESADPLRTLPMTRHRRPRQTLNATIWPVGVFEALSPLAFA